MKEDIVHVKFKITIPKFKWLAILNTRYSELSFNMLSKYLINNNTGITLFEIKGIHISEFLRDLKKNLNDTSFTILHKGHDFLLLNVKTKDPWILNALIKTELMLIYPLKVADGRIHISAVTNREKIDKFLEELEQKDIPFIISKIGQYNRGTILSNRQKEILKRAYRSGYYDIPRSINQTSLASRMGISASALSENLRRIHSKLAEQYLNQ
jgi:predicted DNA binding protein